MVLWPKVGTTVAVVMLVTTGICCSTVNSGRCYVVVSPAGETSDAQHPAVMSVYVVKHVPDTRYYLVLRYNSHV